MKKGLLVMSLVAVVVLMFGAFSCAKPAPAPTTAPTTAPSPAPSPSPTTKPTTTPSPTSAPAPVITLKLAHQYPVGHPHDDDSKWVAAAIKERTKGAIDVQVYPAQTLVKQAVSFEEVSAGRVDMVLTFPYFGQMPIGYVVALPFLWQPGKYEAVLAALTGGLSDAIDKSIEKLDVTLLATWGTGSMHFFSAKKPLKTLEDLKGVMLRSPSGPQSEALVALGVSPVDITATAEIYTAIQRGTVNGAMTSWSSGYSGKLQEVSRYGTAVYFNAGFMMVLGNRTTLNKLPANYQKVIRDVYLERQDWKWKNLLALESADRKQLEEKGMEIYDLPATEWNRWAKLTKGSWDTFLKQGPEAQKLIDLALKYSAPSK